MHTFSVILVTQFLQIFTHRPSARNSVSMFSLNENNSNSKDKFHHSTQYNFES